MPLPIVGVMGSGSRAHADRSEPLGRWLGTLPVHLLTGGGGGVMEAVSRAFAQVKERDGRVIGVLPAAADGKGPPPGYPNPWVEIPVQTHLPVRGVGGAHPMSRNHINVLSASVLVALPGGPGTGSEVQLALRYGVPLVGFLGAPEDIPDFPSSAAWTRNLKEVQAFVLDAL